MDNTEHYRQKIKYQNSKKDPKIWHIQDGNPYPGHLQTAFTLPGKNRFLEKMTFTLYVLIISAGYRKILLDIRF